MLALGILALKDATLTGSTAPLRLKPPMKK